MEILGLSLAKLITLLVGILVLLTLGFIFMRTMTRWIVKVPPDKALIVFGVGTKSRVTVMRKVPDPDSKEPGDAYKLVTEEVDVKFKIVRGGAVLVVPALQECKTLDLGIITLDVRVEDVLSSQAVPITVDGIAQIKVGGDMTYIATAAEQLLDKGVEGIQHVASETLMGHLRSIVGLLTVEETYKDREKFSQRVQEVAVEDMAGMGIEIKSFVIKDIDDKEGYIKALGALEIQAKLRDERIAVAEANRKARETEAQQDLAGKTAELNRDKQVHEQTESTELRRVQKDKTVALAEQDKNRQVAEQQALAVTQQKQAEVIVPAEAEAKAKKIMAEGERQKIEVTAEANAKAAETNARGSANAVKLEADATAEATRKTKTAEADGNQDILLAEAEGTKAKLLAQAEGQLELANAVAAQGQVNLIRELALAMVGGDVDKAKAFAAAIAGIGEKVSIVQFAGGAGNQPNALMGLLQGLPEMGAVLNAQTKALTGQNIEEFLERALTLIRTAGKVQESDVTSELKKTARMKTSAEVSENSSTMSMPVEELRVPLVESPTKSQKPPRQRKNS